MLSRSGRKLGTNPTSIPDNSRNPLPVSEWCLLCRESSFDSKRSPRIGRWPVFPRQFKQGKGGSMNSEGIDSVGYRHSSCRHGLAADKIVMDVRSGGVGRVATKIPSSVSVSSQSRDLSASRMTGRRTWSFAQGLGSSRAPESIAASLLAPPLHSRAIECLLLRYKYITN